MADGLFLRLDWRRELADGFYPRPAHGVLPGRRRIAIERVRRDMVRRFNSPPSEMVARIYCDYDWRDIVFNEPVVQTAYGPALVGGA